MLLAQETGVVGAGPEGRVPETHLKSIEEQVAIRAEFGLAVDAALVTSLSGDESPLLGIPLTPAEELEMERRAHVQSSLGPLSELGASFAGVYGGLWIDQSAGGVINVGLTPAASAAVREALVAAVPANAVVRIRVVAFPLAELERVHSQLEEMAHREQELGLRAIGAISTNVSLNTVDVAVPATAPDTLAPSLLAMFGDRVRIVDDFVLDEQACPNRFSCTPYRGGIDLYRPNGSCTSAYNAKKTGTNN